MASATDCPCVVSTSTCRSFATISSGLCRFLPISNPPSGSKAILHGGSLFSGQTMFIELNVEDADEDQTGFEIHTSMGSRRTRSPKWEKPGDYFHPLLG